MRVVVVSYKYGVPLGDPCCYPLGLMYVAAAVKRLGHVVKVLNYNLHEYDFVREVKGWDIVMFTGYEEFYKLIVRDAATCKTLGIRTIVGGALASFMPQVMITHCDTVVVGEADGNMGYILTHTGIIDGVAGEWWNKLPDYESFGINEYHASHAFRYMGVMASRGCPYHCTFCAQTCKYSVRPIESLLSEIDTYIRDYNISRVVFYDNTLNANSTYFAQLVAYMRDLVKTSWSASIRLDNLTSALVRRMKESGCVSLVVGVESFNQDRLDMMHKNMKVEDIVNGLELLHQYDIKYTGNILVGFTGDTMADVRREVNAIPSGYNVYPTLVQPFIGIKDRARSRLTVEDKQFLKHAFNDYVVAHNKYCYPEVEAVNA